jgi:hypothetical protein
VGDSRGGAWSVVNSRGVELELGSIQSDGQRSSVKSLLEETIVSRWDNVDVRWLVQVVVSLASLLSISIWVVVFWVESVVSGVLDGTSDVSSLTSVVSKVSRAIDVFLWGQPEIGSWTSSSLVEGVSQSLSGGKSITGGASSLGSNSRTNIVTRVAPIEVLSLGNLWFSEHFLGEFNNTFWLLIFLGLHQVLSLEFLVAHIGEIVKLELIAQILLVDIFDLLVVAVENIESMVLFFWGGIESLLSELPVVESDDDFSWDLSNRGWLVLEESTGSDNSKNGCNSGGFVHFKRFFIF